MSFLTRPATYASVIAGYVGLIGIGGYIAAESHDRVQTNHETLEQVCTVVRNVHVNAVFRYHTEQTRLEQTLDYLADPTSKENPALYARVKSTLPTVQAVVKAAKRGAEATRVPPSCRP